MEEYKIPTQNSTQQIGQYLHTLVDTHGKSNWEKVAMGMKVMFPHMRWAAEMYKEKWLEANDQSAFKHPWTEQEELDILIGYRRYQNKWSSISQALNKRDNNTIKNRFYSILRKIINKIKRNDLSCNSKLELLEALYMISLIEQCLQNPLSPAELRKKRGKNYLYSLLKLIKPEDIKKYKDDLQRLNGGNATLEKLWKEFDKEGEDTKQKADPVISNDKLPCLNELNMCNEQKYTLPPPNRLADSEKLTSEEKAFIFFQVFQSKIRYIPDAAQPKPFEVLFYSPLSMKDGQPTPMANFEESEKPARTNRKKIE
eukprot:TRINITY_DN3911_c0_g1_i13.p1 TRINITY_DN3911_c0_g1~~TRINITY_DN3911_c0_g1_i13.p1  ORF type:complete len:313 (+),score=67.49 TRINITY_DN3911_c0_g1_i13:236-1174(+)